jgi:phosphohistidine swiveling domain-containing protein
MTTSAAQQTEPVNPVHMHSGPATRWTTVNFAEAIQGVQTPLSWTVWEYGMETACRRAFGELGVLAKREVPIPPSPDDRMSGIFYGRACGNVAFFRIVGDRMPGSSGDVIEEKLFGKVATEPSRIPPASYRRYPIVMARAPRAIWGAPRRLRPELEEMRTWWRQNTLDAPPNDLAGAQRLIRDAAERFADVGVEHTIVSILGPQLLDVLSDLAEQATGDRSLGPELASGYGSMEETGMIADVWAASQGTLSVTEFQRRHGFHGHDEGKLESRSWREDPAGVEAFLRGYKKSAVEDPRLRERRQLDRRREVEAQIMNGLPAYKRPVARLVMKLASVFIPLREVGKASFLHTLDAGRCAARIGGNLLAEQGLLDQPEDVFFLTLDEFTGTPGPALREAAARRRADHERYLGLELPPSWEGNPEPIAVVAPEAASGTGNLQGIGVVGGVVTGRARVIRDPGAAELDPGDILVCATTDPSWTPLFMLADALVIDTGGQMSHGAIVARELGVPCVINTVTGTRDIPDMATITVDAATGVVSWDDSQGETTDV